MDFVISLHIRLRKHESTKKKWSFCMPSWPSALLSPILALPASKLQSLFVAIFRSETNEMTLVCDSHFTIKNIHTVPWVQVSTLFLLKKWLENISIASIRGLRIMELVVAFKRMTRYYIISQKKLNIFKADVVQISSIEDTCVTLSAFAKTNWFLES